MGYFAAEMLTGPSRPEESSGESVVQEENNHGRMGPRARKAPPCCGNNGTAYRRSDSGVTPAKSCYRIQQLEILKNIASVLGLGQRVNGA